MSQMRRMGDNPSTTTNPDGFHPSYGTRFTVGAASNRRMGDNPSIAAMGCHLHGPTHPYGLWERACPRTMHAMPSAEALRGQGRSHKEIAQ